MKRFIKGMLKFLILIFIVLCISWFGLKYYFSHVNIIADKVRRDVLTQVQAHHRPVINVQRYTENVSKCYYLN